jgi:hypothetical protein
MNCDLTSGSVPSKKLSIENTGDDIVDILECKDQDDINININENLYYDYMLNKHNTEDAFCERNVNLFNFEDYFSV